MGNIVSGKIILSDLKYIDFVDHNLYLETNDLLYNRTNEPLAKPHFSRSKSESVPERMGIKGRTLFYFARASNSLDLIGKVEMYEGNDEFPVRFASYLVRLRANARSIPAYLAYLLNTNGVLGVARANAFVAIGQCNLNPTRYGEIKVAIPPRDEQANLQNFLMRNSEIWMR